MRERKREIVISVTVKHLGLPSYVVNSMNANPLPRSFFSFPSFFIIIIIREVHTGGLIKLYSILVLIKRKEKKNRIKVALVFNQWKFTKEIVAKM